MVAVGRSIAAIVSIPLNGEVANIIKDLPGQVLQQDSAVDIFLTREGDGVLFTVTVGGVNVYPAAPANINTVNGSLPSVRDDRVISLIADANDAVIIQAANSSGAALEARALVKTMPVAALGIRGGRGG